MTSDGMGLVYPSDTEAGLDTRRLAANDTYEQSLWTFQDAVEHVLDVFDIPRDPRNTRMAMRAVLKAHRGLPKYHAWPYYVSRFVLNAVAPYSTGTVVFKLTGGSYEQLLTLTGGTWPSWAGFGTIRIAQTNYPILQRVDDTRLTLDARRHPLADVSATTYTLFRERYPLPLDFRRSDRVLQPNTLRELDSTSPSSLGASSVFLRGLATPYQAAIVGDPKFQNGLALQLTPPGSAAVNIVFNYDRAQRPLRTEKYSTGTIATTQDSAVITGTSTVFTEAMIGSVLRISADATEPTPIYGSIASTTINAPTYQRIVMARTSNTSISLDQTIPETVSGRGYVISDPIDVHEVMIDAFYRLAEVEFARLTGRDDANERSVVFFAELDVARDAVRHSTAIQSGNIGQESYFSYLGDVNPTKLASV